jgi:hypothetical protein
MTNATKFGTGAARTRFPVIETGRHKIFLPQVVAELHFEPWMFRAGTDFGIGSV